MVLGPQSYAAGYNSRPWNVLNGQFTAQYADVVWHSATPQSGTGSLTFPKSGVISRAEWVEDGNAETSTLRLYLRNTGVFTVIVPATMIRSATLFSPSRKNQRRGAGLTVLLDPGHGGYDGGANALGVNESTVNLSIAQLIKAKLEAAGINVIMTHNGIVSSNVMKLDERTAVIRSSNPDLSISIHCNSNTSSSVSGVK